MISVRLSEQNFFLFLVWLFLVKVLFFVHARLLNVAAIWGGVYPKIYFFCITAIYSDLLQILIGFLYILKTE